MKTSGPSLRAVTARAGRSVLSASRYLRPKARRTVARITERLFDTEWYAARNGLASRHQSRDHYVAIGAWVGLAPHPLIDPAWLCRPHIRRGRHRRPGPFALSRAVLDFVRAEPSQACDPHPLFDVAWYRAAAAMPEDSPVDVLSHFLLIGEAAGLSPHPLIDPSILQRELECVLRADADRPRGSSAAAQTLSPLTTYAAGRMRDARTHELFHGAAYRSQNADVQSAGVVPLEHYVRSGLSEGRPTLTPLDEGWARVRWGLSDTEPFEPLPLVRRFSAESLDEARRDRDAQLRQELRDFLRASSDGSVTPWPDDSAARITAIIPVWNQAHATLACLRALFAAAQHAPIRVHVVDNGSGDETSAVLARFTGITRTTWDENRGYGAAVNHAAAQATTEYLLLLNNDAFVEPEAIASALRVLDEQQDAGAVCARIILPNGMLQEAGSYVLPDGSARGYLRGSPAGHSEALHRRDVDFGSAAFLAVRHEVFTALQGFRPEFGLAYGEDVDLMLRMWEFGHRVVYEPQCLVHHLEGASTATQPEKVALMRAANARVRSFHTEFFDARAAAAIEPFVLHAHSRASRQRIVVIDDEVPDRRAGAGQPRALAVLEHLLQREDATVTLLTRAVVRSADQRLHARVLARAIDPGIELLEGLPVDLLVDWLDANAGRIDVVWVSRSHNMSDLQSELARRGRTRLNSRTIFDSEALVTERDAALDEHLGRPWTRAELAARSSAEFDCAKAADLIVSVADHEAALYRTRSAIPVHVVGHRIDALHGRHEPPQGSRVLFVGRIAEEESPNALGLRWFLDEVWPAIAEQSDAELDIIGLAGAWLDPYRSARVHIHGMLDDLTDQYREARVFVAPVFFGAGIPHKVHEAAAHGVPVVTTGIIARQVGATGAVAVAATACEFQTEILALMQDDARWWQYYEAARRRVQDDCDPDHFTAGLSTALRAARAPGR